MLLGRPARRRTAYPPPPDRTSALWKHANVGSWRSAALRFRRTAPKGHWWKSIFGSGREVQFQCDAGRVRQEHLEQSQPRHSPFDVRRADGVTTRPHSRPVIGEKRDMIERAGPKRVTRWRDAQVVADRVRPLAADQVNDAQRSLIVAEVEPDALKREWRTGARAQLENVLVEAARGTVRVNSILTLRAVGPRAASLFLLGNRPYCGRVVTPKIGYNQLL